MGIGENVHSKSDADVDKNRPASIGLGIVKKNWDKAHPGMVKVNILIDGGEEVLSDWMPVAMPYAADGSGLFLMPEVGSIVVIGYIDDNSVSPVVIGSIWGSSGKNSSKLPKDNADDKNSKKVFSTPKGQMIKIDEGKDTPSIEIISSKKQRVFLDDKNELLEVSSGGNDNRIMIDGKNGKIVIEAKKEISIKVGGKAIETFSSTETNIKCDKMSYDGKMLQLKGKQTKMEGSVVDVNSSGNLNIKASGMAQIKGSMLKLN